VGKFNDTIVAPEVVWSTTTPLFIVGNGTSSGARSNAMVVRNDGLIGMGTSNPQKRLHLSQGTGGNLYHSNAMMILEDDTHFYVQFSAADGFESGLLYGNSGNAIRSGLIFDADHHVELRAGGNTTRLRIESGGDADFQTGEIQRTSTGNSNLVPICYGSVNSSGVINSGTGNFTVTTPSTGRYDIEITDEVYLSSSYSATANAISSAARMVSLSSSGGNLVVRIFDAAGTLVDNGFQFVVFQQ
jgi:hypothetical protein